MKRRRKRPKTRKRQWNALAAAFVAAGGLLVLATAGTWFSGPSVAVADADVVVYKRANCACCHEWVRHLQDDGLLVSVVNVASTSAVQSRLGVPSELHACHTATVGAYWVEGHVPADLVLRLMREQPSDLRGIAVAGMPIGSPGMGGANPERYSVMSMSTTGEIDIYATRQGESSSR